MNSRIKRGMGLFVVLALLMSLMPAPAYAATAKKTVKNQKFTTVISTVRKKATTVKKGTTNLTIKKGKGYVYFKAPKAATYTFTLSNIKEKSENRFYAGYWYIMKKMSSSSKYISMEKVKTEGGKDSTLRVAVNKKPSYKETGKKIYHNLLKRSGTLKLKKGEEVFLYFNTGTSNKNATATLNIKSAK